MQTHESPQGLCFITAAGHLTALCSNVFLLQVCGPSAHPEVCFASSKAAGQHLRERQFTLRSLLLLETLFTNLGQAKAMKNVLKALTQKIWKRMHGDVMVRECAFIFV